MAPNGAPAKSAPPNQTLYITNLNDKVRKEDLRRALYCLFSTHGPVLDVVALKTMKMRGQAHVVFRDVQTSTQAMRALQGFDLLGKELKIQYAKGKSGSISKLDGSAEAPKTKAESSATAAAASQSIFNAPSLIPQAGAPKTGSLKPNGVAEEGAKSPAGVKRPREDDSEAEDAPMDEDDDDDAMEESDDD